MSARYINCTSWNADFCRFDKFLHELNADNYCILGDLNARVANKQVLDTNSIQSHPFINGIRVSKDQLVNAHGNKLLELCENIGGII